MSTIRPAKLLDLEAILWIEEQSYPTPWTSEFFIEELENPLTSAFVLEEEKEVLGYVFFRVIQGDGHLNNIAVHPEFRRQGYGDELLHFVLSEVEQEGCRSLFLEVRPNNQAAISMYRKHGFLLLGRRPNYYSSGEDALILMKEITSAAVRSER